MTNAVTITLAERFPQKDFGAVTDGTSKLMKAAQNKFLGDECIIEGLIEFFSCTLTLKLL